MITNDFNSLDVKYNITITSIVTKGLSPKFFYYNIYDIFFFFSTRNDKGKVFKHSGEG